MASPGDIAIVGDEANVGAQLGRLSRIGATDFVAAMWGDGADRDPTWDYQRTYGSETT